ncbi:unnamed protein product [Phytophthora fragariaefolia]|uniref:Unnamed protein product n=1 Tax=Phytophthora fragariaefolia TaxID=1490495 RepID=A0A9W6U998_9STRA|nr:unnamed protein product [Phytophthora fragariaefolia]
MPPGLLQPLEIPGGRWVDVSMDFMIVLTSTETGKDAIMVIVDLLTKRAKFIATNTNATAEETAALFMVNYVKDHGVPKSIISDRDSKFTSKFWQEVIKPLETTHNLSSAFHPQTDGQTEHVFVHSSIDMSPFEADLGYVPYMPDDVARDPDFEQLHKSAQEFLLKQDAILKMAQDAMSEAQTRMKSYYDKNRLAQDFKPGDMLKLSKGLKLHPVFHTTLLKPYRSDESRSQSVYKVILKDGTEGQLVREVIGHRNKKKKLQYRIWWLGESREEATREPVENLNQIPGLIDKYWETKKRKPASK